MVLIDASMLDFLDDFNNGNDFVKYFCWRFSLCCLGAITRRPCKCCSFRSIHNMGVVTVLINVQFTDVDQILSS